MSLLMGVASPKPGVGSSWKSSTSLVLNERITRKIEEYPSYISAFKAKIDQKSTFFGEKRPKMKFSYSFWDAQENFRVFRAVIPSQSTNFNP